MLHRIKYGECKVYNYSKNKTEFVKYFIRDYDFALDYSDWKYMNNKSFQKNLSDAIDKSLSQSDNDSDFKTWIKDGKLSNAIIQNWVEENEFYLLESEYKLLTEARKRVDANDNELINGLKTINENLYFSKEGIIIRKSKTPYIF